MNTCQVPLCTRPPLGRMDVCRGHYVRFRNTGEYRPEVPFQRQTIIAGGVEERFWGRVDKSGDCWLFQPSSPRGTYGTWSYHLGGGKRRAVRAHRFAWETANGPVPAGLHVLHKCDNPPCCNPDHLFLGTHDDNMKDKAEKGRVRAGDARGERNGHAKLTAMQVLDLRARAALGERQCDLAREFAVTPQTVWNIINRYHWKHV